MRSLKQVMLDKKLDKIAKAIALNLVERPAIGLLPGMNCPDISIDAAERLFERNAEWVSLTATAKGGDDGIIFIAVGLNAAAVWHVTSEAVKAMIIAAMRDNELDAAKELAIMFEVKRQEMMEDHGIVLDPIVINPNDRFET